LKHRGGCGPLLCCGRAAIYEVARGSAAESGAALEVLRLRRLTDHRRLAEARSLAIRVVQMLSRLGRPHRAA
jgi:hypothetical protein